MTACARRGFALIAVLWLVTAASVVSTAAILLGRDGLRLAENRSALLRAEWRAEECLERARVVLARPNPDPDAPRRSVITVAEDLVSDPLVLACPGAVSLLPLGSTLDVNWADAATLRKLLSQVGVAASRSDSLVAALVDWRDADREPSKLGAEEEWYRQRGLPEPRNGKIADLDELDDVRGWSSLRDHLVPTRLTDLLGVDDVPALIEVIPRQVASALPGVTVSLAAVIERRREARESPLPELQALLSLASERDRDSLAVGFPALIEAATVRSAGWRLRATASGVSDDPHANRLQVTMEVLLINDGSRLAIADRRISP